MLEGLAQSSRDDEEGECSWDPWDYGHCFEEAVEAVFEWTERWGHLALDILSLATFAPPPFSAVGLGAAATNATWYAIEGDYTDAGLSLAAAVPGLVFTKVAKAVKAGATAEKAATQADEVARTANEIRTAIGTGSRVTRVVTADDLEVRPSLLPTTKAAIQDAAPKTNGGDFIDPNIGKVLPVDGIFHYGHKPGYEWRCTKERALREGWTRRQLIDYFNDPTHYQIEDPISNLSHLYEASVCAS